MSIQNTADTEVSIIQQAVLGTTPTTGTLRHEIPVAEDHAPFEATSQEIKSTTKRANRSSNGSRRGPKEVSGTLAIRGQSVPAVTMLFEGTFANSFVGGELKAGKSDKYYTIIEKLGAGIYARNTDCVVRGMTLSAKFGEAVTYGFDMLGLDQHPEATDSPISLTRTSGLTEYDGAVVSNIAIGGQSFAFSDLEMKVGNPYTQLGKLGSNSYFGYGYNGQRTIDFTVTAFLESLSAHTLLQNDVPMSFSFDIGEEDDGLHVNCPEVDFSFPKSVANSGAIYVTFTGSARIDDVTQTNCIITQL